MSASDSSTPPEPSNSTARDWENEVRITIHQNSATTMGRARTLGTPTSKRRDRTRKWDDDNKTERDSRTSRRAMRHARSNQWKVTIPGFETHPANLAELCEVIGAIPSDNKWPCTYRRRAGTHQIGLLQRQYITFCIAERRRTAMTYSEQYRSCRMPSSSARAGETRDSYHVFSRTQVLALAPQAASPRALPRNLAAILGGYAPQRCRLSPARITWRCASPTLLPQRRGFNEQR